MTELLAKTEVHAVVGAAMEVHNELGAGFLEAVYQEFLEMELADRRIPFEAQAQLLNYLKASSFEVGVSINFGAPPKFEWERRVRTNGMGIPNPSKYSP